MPLCSVLCPSEKFLPAAFLRKVFLYFLFLTVITLTCLQVVRAGDDNYREIFGPNWEKAEKFLAVNKIWIDSSLKANHLNFDFTVAVVFPELIRYSAVRDRIEITLLKALYVQYGDEYADFSVGVFQMKPSCAEKVLEGIADLKNKKLSGLFKTSSDLHADRERRSLIVRDMENPETQFLYVIAMLKLLDKKFRNKTWGYDRKTGTMNKLTFYATAYNCGFFNDEDYIMKQSVKKSFHTGLVNTKTKYIYSDISRYFYKTSGKEYPLPLLP